MPRWIATLDDARLLGQGLIAICHNPVCRRAVRIDLDGLIYHVGAAASVTPVRGAEHFSERMRCSACGHRGVFLWIEAPRYPEPLFGLSSQSQVNLWGRGTGDLLDTVLIRASQLELGYAGYNAALDLFPGRRITLQEGMHVIQDSRFKLIAGGRR